MIRAYDTLRDEIDDLSVVFVGKAGWMTDELQDRMRSHPDHGGRFRWLDKVDDTLLTRCFATRTWPFNRRSMRATALR
ncbi:MAG: hypothetical protein R2689_07525 [Microthrixaceae bacterium]